MYYTRLFVLINFVVILRIVLCYDVFYFVFTCCGFLSRRSNIFCLILGFIYLFCFICLYFDLCTVH